MNLKSGLLLAALGISGSASADVVCTSYWPWGACATWETTSTLSSEGSQRGYDKIYLKNDCWKEIQTALHYKDRDGVWKTEGWWTLAPRAKAYVANTANSIFFVYAESTGGEPSKVWSGNDFHSTVRNGTVRKGFRKVQSNRTQWVDYTYSFSCD